MTVPADNSPKTVYKGPFEQGILIPINWSYTEKDHVKCVTSDGKELVYNVDYEIIHDTDLDTSTIRLKNSDTEFYKDITVLTVYRDTPLDQQAEFPQNARFNSSKLNNELDKICRQQQEQQEQLNRALKVGIEIEEFNIELPTPVGNNTFKFNEDATALEIFDIDKVIADNKAAQDLVIETNNLVLHSELDNYKTEVNSSLADMTNTMAMNKAEQDEVIATNKSDTDKQISDFKADVTNTLATTKAEQDKAISDFKQEVNENIATTKAAQDKVIADGKAEQDKTIADATADLQGQINTFKTDITDRVDAFETATSDSITEQQEYVQQFMDNVNQQIDVVYDAAKKIDQLKDSVDQATVAADNATQAAAQATTTAEKAEELANSLSGSVAQIETNKTDIANLTSTKADKTTITELSEVVNTKADKATISNINQQLDDKVAFSDLSVALEDKVAFSDLSVALEDKVSQSAFDATVEGIYANVDNKADKINTLSYSNISNCILSAPHMVDVVIEDNRAILKAGSRVIVPYGTSAPTLKVGESLGAGDIYQIVDISWDGSKLFYICEVHIDLPDKFITGLSIKTMCMVNTAWSDTLDMYIQGANLFAGNTAPTATIADSLWYDTTSNFIKVTRDTGATWGGVYAFPSFECNYADGNVTSIAQTFQHLGYIGSTVWAMKGIRGLMADGKYDDGTYRNFDFELPNVITYDMADETSNAFFLTNHYSNFFNIRGWGAIIQNGNNLPNDKNYYRYFHKDENQWYVRTSDTDWEKTRCVVISWSRKELGNVTSLDPVPPVNLGHMLDKTGDTMTGTLNIENTTIEAQAPTMIRFQNTALPQIAPSADYYSKQRGAIKFFSSDDILTNAVSSYISASGENALALDSNTLLPNGTKATGYVRIYSNSKGEVHTECCDTTTNLQSIVNRKFLQNSGGFATYSKAGNGYYKFINGLIIQWGSFAGNSSTVTVTFPTAFTANPTFVCARPLTSTKIADDSGGASSLSKTNCKFFAWNGWQYKWIAIGY